jgi:hypothetical protein
MSHSMAGVNKSSLAWAPSTSKASCTIAGPVAVEQAGHARFHHGVAVIEHALAAHARHFGNLLAGHLVRRDQAPHPRSLPRPFRLRLRPSRFNFLHQLFVKIEQDSCPPDNLPKFIPFR